MVGEAVANEDTGFIGERILLNQSAKHSNKKVITVMLRTTKFKRR